MKKGRKPKSTAAKQLAGNPGRRPLNDAEPAFDATLPPPPAHLVPAAQEEWHRITSLLLAARVLTAADVALLSAYCQAWGRWCEAETALKTHGPIVKSPSGYPIQNPWLSVANKALEQLARYAAEFGLTPSSRSRVRTLEPPKTTETELFD